MVDHRASYAQLALVAVGGGLLVAGGTWLASRKRKAALQKPHKQAWLLIVNLTFPNLKERDKFLPIFAELAKSVAAKERGVLAYELSIADNDPLKIVIFERYVAKHPHYDPMHRSSEAYKTFQSQVLDQVEVASKDGQSYIEQDIGYM
ncbi:hypothetical protein WJX84_001467 [Apatococcus fuscideae]|uniref:ABM domain-containing protein n=1 Tax=Apatococcus fuscideae TaxID=2026836 RepID=A0AAW1SUW5_9CHLO